MPDLKVLIADDDPLVAAYLEIKLASRGCAVELVGDGAQALERLQASRFDVLITDWVMPNMDGLELTRAARQLGEDYLHIIVMTASGAESTIREALDAGADGFLYKPVDDLQVELGLGSAARVVALERKLQRRARHLATMHERARTTLDRLRSELEAAADLQKRLLPLARTEGPFRYSLAFQPSLDIGGDSLGVVPLASGGTFFFNIDVSGHGVRAALNSFALHTRLVNMAPEADTLEDIAARLNDEVLAQDNDVYFTVVLGTASADGADVRLIRAGHPPPILMRADGMTETLEEGGLPLGMLPGARHSACDVTLQPGDRILIYTDGVTEDGLGEDGLLDLCRALGPSDSATAVQAITWRLGNIRRGRPPSDDISLLLLERSALG